VLPGKVYTPEAVLEIAWRHKWLIVLPFALIATGVAAYSQVLPNLYRSETLVMVVPQRIPDTYIRSTVTSRIEDRLRSISEQILSRTNLEQVILEFDLYTQQRVRMSMEEVVEIMRAQIEVQPVRGDMFRIAFVARDAEVASKVVTRLADMYIDENQRDRTVIADDTSEFLGSQLAEAKTRLVDHERKLEAYRLRHSGELPSQFQSNLQMLQATQVQLQSLADGVGRDRDRRLALENALAEARKGGAPSIADRAALGLPAQPPGSSLADQLDRANGELRELQRRLTTTHPDVVAKARQVEDLEARLAAAPLVADPIAEAAGTAALIRDTQVRQLEAEIAKLDLQIADKEQQQIRLNDVIAEYRKRVEAVPTRETEMIELMRDYDTLQRTYTSLLTSQQGATIAANLERRQIGEQFKVLDPARPAERPFSPNRYRLNLLGALAGLGLGLGLAALAEYRDTSFRTEEDVLRVLTLPVIAVIPFMESPREQRTRRLRLLLLGFTSLAGVLIFAIVVGMLAMRYMLGEWFR
jgi:polysaccharide chain length determinant protein (PEP-CTERM system associated)